MKRKSGSISPAMENKELADYVLQSVGRAKALVDESNAMEDIPITPEQKAAQGYIHGLNNFYTRHELRELCLKDFKEYYLGFNKADESPSQDQIAITMELVRAYKTGSVFLGLLAGLSLSGMAYEKMFIIPALFCGVKAVRDYFSYRSCKKELGRMEAAKTGDNAKKIEELDSKALEAVLDENEEEIRKYL